MNNKVVYRHRRLDTNQVFYVGYGVPNRPYSKSKRNPYWYNIINFTEYKIEILAENLSLEDAKELEVLLIKEYGRKDLNTGILCNMTDGGDGGSNTVCSPETREKLSIAGKNRILSEEHKRKIGEKSKLRRLSIESREKIRQFNLGKIISEEEKHRLRTMNIGRIKSKEECLKLSLAHKGKPKSETHKLNLSLTHPGKKKVICTETNKIWESVVKCAEENLLCKYCLARKLRGKVKNNTTFKYIE